MGFKEYLYLLSSYRTSHEDKCLFTILSSVSKGMAKNEVPDHIHFVTTSIACLVLQEFRGRSFNN